MCFNARSSFVYDFCDVRSGSAGSLAWLAESVQAHAAPSQQHEAEETRNDQPGESALNMLVAMGFSREAASASLVQVYSGLVMEVGWEMKEFRGSRLYSCPLPSSLLSFSTFSFNRLKTT